MSEYPGVAANCLRLIMLTGARPIEAMMASWSQFDAEPGYWCKPSAHTKQRKVHKLALTKRPKAILPGSYFWPRIALRFSDERWAATRRHIIEPLSPEADARLRKAVTRCCSWFLNVDKRLEDGRATAAAIRKPHKDEAALLERVVNGLRAAAQAPTRTPAMLSWYFIERAYFSLISAVSRSPMMPVEGSPINETLVRDLAGGHIDGKERQFVLELRDGPVDMGLGNQGSSDVRAR
jgi:hypothetical protein